MRKIIAMFEIDDEQAERYCKENGYEGVSPDELFESEMGFAEGGITLKNWRELGDAHESYWNARCLSAFLDDGIDLAGKAIACEWLCNQSAVDVFKSLSDEDIARLAKEMRTAVENDVEIGITINHAVRRAFAEGKPVGKAVEALTIPPKDRLLKERDEQLKALWEEFQNIPRSDADRRFAHITEDFYFWKAGTDANEILSWFEARHSYGVQKLLYPNTPTTQEEEDEEEIRFAIEDMDDEDISDCYGITRKEMMKLVPEMARRMRKYIDESEDWFFKRDRAIEHVAEDYKNGKYRD